MILIFDLDDTLYDELSYVHSGFSAVAQWGQDRYNLDAEASYTQLVQLLAAQGRGRIFNDWLGYRRAAQEAVRIYRHHLPTITPWDTALRTLEQVASHPLYVVTDGHKVVQAKKWAALGLAPRFRHAYITHRYGIAHEKPSPRCFSLIRQRERCNWQDMLYVGDNPAKDFVGLNPLGVHTVRVLTGQHRAVVAQPGFEAQHRISTLTDLPDLLNRL